MWERRGPTGFRSQAFLEDLNVKASSASCPSTWLACSRVSADNFGSGLCARRALTFRTGVTWPQVHPGQWLLVDVCYSTSLRQMLSCRRQ